MTITSLPREFAVNGYNAGTRDLFPPPQSPLMISMASQITIAMNSTSEGSSPMCHLSMKKSRRYSKIYPH